jgi:hypothetical protein
MKRLKIGSDAAELAFSLDELDLLRNGLNEARLAVRGEADFETRLGATREEARALIQDLIDVMAEVIRSREERAAGKTRAAHS